MRVTTSQPGPNRFEQSLPLSPSPGSEFWEGSGERRRGGIRINVRVQTYNLKEK